MTTDDIWHFVLQPTNILGRAFAVGDDHQTTDGRRCPDDAVWTLYSTDHGERGKVHDADYHRPRSSDVAASALDSLAGKLYGSRASDRGDPREPDSTISIRRKRDSTTFGDQRRRAPDRSWPCSESVGDFVPTPRPPWSRVSTRRHPRPRRSTRCPRLGGRLPVPRDLPKRVQHPSGGPSQSGPIPPRSWLVPKRDSHGSTLRRFRPSPFLRHSARRSTIIIITYTISDHAWVPV